MFYGLVLALRHDKVASVETDGRRRLSAYIKACRRGFFNNQSAFQKTFMDGDALKANFRGQWNMHIGDSSLEAFNRHIVGRASNLQKWEIAWRDKVLSIDVNKTYGGLGKGDTATRHGQSFY